MKAKRSLHVLAVLALCITPCLTACGEEEIELPPASVELDEPFTYEQRI